MVLLYEKGLPSLIILFLLVFLLPSSVSAQSKYVMLIINSSLIFLFIVIAIIFKNKTRFLENKVTNLSAQLNSKDYEIKD